MFARRFSTTSGRLAFTRARYAARSTAKPAPSSATATSSATKPAAAKSASPSATTSAASRTAAPSAVMPNGASGASGASGATSNGAASNAFTPRLVPELKTQPTSTKVQDVIDPEVFVNNTENLELSDDAVEPEPNTDWTTSYQGLGSAPFEPRVVDTLLAPIVPEDVEITPDGLLYLPEIKYRRILNRAFGPGGWGIAPRTKTMVTQKQVTREYALICLGRLVSVSRGEMDYFSAEGITTAMEGCKSNALMRCCKDLGIASELWDPSFIRSFKSKYCESKFFEKKRRFVWKRKDRVWEYPYI